MDRLAAYSAVTVLAFGAGYLVSSYVNAPAALTGALNASGVIDMPPRLLSLGDVVNQTPETLFADLSEADVRELKELIMPLLSPADLKRWRAVRTARVENFIREGQEIWATGRDDAPVTRLDRALAGAAQGSYQGKLRVDADQEALYDFMLQLDDLGSDHTESRLMFHKPDGTPAWGVQFRWSRVGSLPETRQLALVWPAFDQDENHGAWTHYALLLPVDTQPDLQIKGDVYGLDHQLTWNVVGHYEALRTTP